MDIKKPVPEASAPIDREFLATYGQLTRLSPNHEEYVYCGQKYGVSFDPAYPLNGGWKVYRIYRVD